MQSKPEKKTTSIAGHAAGSSSASLGVKQTSSISGHAIRRKPGTSSLHSMQGQEIGRPIGQEEWARVSKLYQIEQERAALVADLGFPPGYDWTIDPRAGTITFRKTK